MLFLPGFPTGEVKHIGFQQKLPFDQPSALVGARAAATPRIIQRAKIGHRVARTQLADHRRRPRAEQSEHRQRVQDRNVTLPVRPLQHRRGRSIDEGIERVTQEHERWAVEAGSESKLEIVTPKPQRLRIRQRRVYIDAVETTRPLGLRFGGGRLRRRARLQLGRHRTALRILRRAILLHLAEPISPPTHA